MIYSKDEFIKLANEVHNNKYDYSTINAKEVNTVNNIKIICPKHGGFEQYLANHLKGHGCDTCAREKKAMNTKLKKAKAFFELAPKLHNNEFEYLSEYTGTKDKMKMRHKVCGHVFWQTPSNHTHKTSPRGCPGCKDARTSKTKTRSLEYIKELFNKQHNNKYDYSLFTEYNGDNTMKIKIICPVEGHGLFEQRIATHQKGTYGCPKCAIIANTLKQTKTFEDFVKDAKKVHGDRYTYIKSTYKNTDEKTCIICWDHGEYWMQVSKHIYRGSRCPKCNHNGKSQLEKKLLESIKKAFPSLHIIENEFGIIRSPRNFAMELDIYILDINLAIEFNGVYWHSDKMINKKTDGYFKTATEKHNYKTNECKKKNIELIHIFEEDYRDKSLQSKLFNELVNIINEKVNNNGR